MVNFSFFTLLSTQIIISILIIVIYFCVRSNTFICKYGIYFITMPLLACTLRFMFPFETGFSIVLRSPNVVSNIYTLYRSSIMEYEVSHIIYIIMHIGIAVSLFMLIKSFYHIYNLSINSIEITSQQDIETILSKLKIKYNYNKNIKILLNYKLNTPFVFGYIKPTIYMPDINYNKNELQYILEHELVHFFHKDLWLKLIIQLICIIYWWNPFIYLLRDILSHSLELKCDSYICKDLSIEEKKAYLYTIMHTIESSNNTIKKSTVISNFGKKTSNDSLIQRFELVFDYKYKLDKYKIFSIIFSLILFAFTYSVVIQPAYAPTYNDYIEDNGEGFMINENTSYIVKKSDGYYLYYADDEMYKLTESELKTLLSANLKIKDNKEVLK